MTIPGNPKEYARDIAAGFVVFNQATCRQYAAGELAILYRLLEQVAREIRAEQVPLDQVAEIQRKNRRLARVTTALLFIRSHAKRRRIVL